MDKSRSSSGSKHSKRVKKSSKKSKRHRRSPYFDEDDSRYDKMRSSKEASLSNKLVEYSDVSSEDFSAPEAGEIQDEENLIAFSDRDGINKNNGSTSKRYGSAAGAMASGMNNSSPPTQRKIIVGSPISSSLSSHSRSQHRHVRINFY